MDINFKDFINEEDDMQRMVLELCTIMDSEIEVLYEMVDEDDYTLLENVFTDLGKSLVHIKKGKGLIQYFKQAGVGMAKLFMATIKGDVDEVKKIAKSVKATDVMDFLLKLDQATLHLITGPLHSLEAITGWHIWANVQKAHATAGKVVDKIKDAIKTIKSNIGNFIAGTKMKQYMSYLNTIEVSLNDPSSVGSMALAGKR